MTNWWDESSGLPDGSPSAGPGDLGASNVPSGVLADGGDARASRIGILGSNSVTVGIVTGLLAAFVGLAIAGVLNGTIFASSDRWHLGVRSLSVALLVGGLLAGWAPFTAGQWHRAFQRAATAGIGTAAVTAVLLPLADQLWQRSRDDSGPGSLWILVGAWFLIGGLAGAVAGSVDGPTRSRRGLIGGLLGGLIGGVLFVATSGDFRFTEQSSGLSQLFGYTATALGIGLGVGVTERLTRSIWLQALDGPHAGREFVLYRQHLTVGSNPRSDIYLGPDPRVASTHVELSVSQSSIELVNLAGEVYVDGEPYNGMAISSGSVIRVGMSYLRLQTN